MKWPKTQLKVTWAESNTLSNKAQNKIKIMKKIEKETRLRCLLDRLHNFTIPRISDNIYTHINTYTYKFAHIYNLR